MGSETFRKHDHEQDQSMYLWGTFQLWMFTHLLSGESQWLIVGFLIVFGQLLSTTAQMNELYQALDTCKHIVLSEGSVHFWFLSFHGIC